MPGTVLGAGMPPRICHSPPCTELVAAWEKPVCQACQQSEQKWDMEHRGGCAQLSPRLHRELSKGMEAFHLVLKTTGHWLASGEERIRKQALTQESKHVKQSTGLRKCHVFRELEARARAEFGSYNPWTHGQDFLSM